MNPALARTVAAPVAVCLAEGTCLGKGAPRFSDRTPFVHFNSPAAIGARVEWASEIVPGLAILRVEDPRLLDLAETLIRTLDGVLGCVVQDDEAQLRFALRSCGGELRV